VLIRLPVTLQSESLSLSLLLPLATQWRLGSILLAKVYSHHDVVGHLSSLEPMIAARNPLEQVLKSSATGRFGLCDHDDEDRPGQCVPVWLSHYGRLGWKQKQQ
jgi:hypothetical protein